VMMDSMRLRCSVFCLDCVEDLLFIRFIFHQKNWRGGTASGNKCCQLDSKSCHSICLESCSRNRSLARDNRSGPLSNHTGLPLVSESHQRARPGGRRERGKCSVPRREARRGGGGGRGRRRTGQAKQNGMGRKEALFVSFSAAHRREEERNSQGRRGEAPHKNGDEFCIIFLVPGEEEN